MSINEMSTHKGHNVEPKVMGYCNSVNVWLFVVSFLLTLMECHKPDRTHNANQGKRNGSPKWKYIITFLFTHHT